MKLRTKLIIASLILLVLSITGALLVQYFFQNRNEKQLENSLAKVDSLATFETEQIKEEVKETIQNFGLNQNKDEIYYYNLDNNKFYKTNLNNKRNQAILPFATIENLIDSKWSPDANNVLAVSQDNSKKIYSISNSKEYPIDSNLSSLFWLDNNQLIANFYNPENSTNKIIIIDSQGDLKESILDLGTSVLALDINFIGSSSNKVYYLLNGDFFELNIKTKTSNKISNQPVTAAKMSPKNDKIVFSTYTDAFTDFIFDIASQETKQLQNVSLDANSILWSNDENSLYLIKSNLETNEGSGGYSYYLLDKIEKYNINNQQIEKTIDVINQGKYGADDFFLSNDESKIYFVNAANNYLYSINLK